MFRMPWLDEGMQEVVSLVSKEESRPASEALYQQELQAKCLYLTRKDGRAISKDANMKYE